MNLPDVEDVLAPVPVLTYHSIPAGDALVDRDVPLPVFRRQLHALAEAGWQPRGVAEAVAARTADPAARVVGISFDDGYRDVLPAAEVVAGLGGSCTVYAITGRLGGSFEGRRCLTRGEFVELASTGCEIGSHTHTHPRLDRVTNLRRELRSSKEILEELLGAAVDGIAYPYGTMSAHATEVVRDAGYRYACAVDGSVGVAREDSRFAIPRLTPTAALDEAGIVRLVEGPTTGFVRPRPGDLRAAIGRRLPATVVGLSRLRSPAFRSYVVRVAQGRHEGVSLREVARDYRIPLALLQRWLARSGETSDDGAR